MRLYQMSARARTANPPLARRRFALALIPLLLVAALLASCGAEWDQAATPDPDLGYPTTQTAPGTPPAAAPDSAEVLPATATLSEIAANPQPFLEQGVIVNGIWGETLDPRAFVLVDVQDQSEMLVIGSSAVTIPDPNFPALGPNPLVQVTGVVRLFEPTALAAETGVGLDSPQLAVYQGQPAIIATEMRVIEDQTGTGN